MIDWIINRLRREENAQRAEENRRRAAARVDARARKRASKAQGFDVFKSEARRQRQAARDVRELARPIWSGLGWFRLRDIFDRMLRRSNEDHRRHEIAEGDNVCGCDLDGDELAARRVKKKANRDAARRRRFHRPVSARNAARAAS